MKKTKIFKRLLMLALTITIVNCTSNVTAFAAEVDGVEFTATETDVAEIDETKNDLDPETIVIFDQEGNISGYKTAEEITDLNINRNVTNDGLIISSAIDAETDIVNEDTTSLYANSKMEKVNIFTITQPPYRTACFIYAIFPDGEAEGSTGTLVGKNVVLASGHGVYEPKHGGMATTILVTPGFYHDNDGQHYPWGQAQSTSVWMASGYQNDLKSEYDWSLICLNKSFPYVQSYGYAPNYSDLINRNVRAIGYIKESVSPEVWNMYTATGTITGASEYLIQYTISLVNGNSGGPIIDVATGAVIGVINNSSNLGPIITSNNAVRINEWLNGIITQCIGSNQ